MGTSQFPDLSIKLQSIPRLECPDPATFASEHVPKGKPLIITGALAGWKALERWKNWDYLLEAARDRKVVLRRLDPSGESFYQTGSLAQYIDELRNDSTPRRKPSYLAELPLQDVFPDLLGDVPPTPYHHGAPEQFSIMMGRTSYAPLHFHTMTEAISAQVVGSKRFILFHPSASRFLRPCAWHSPMFNFSELDLSAGVPPQVARRLRGVDVFEATLNAGEFLYIPVNWWHAVYGGTEFNILLANFFASQPNRLHFPYPGLAVVAQSFMRQLLPPGFQQKRAERLVANRGEVRPETG